MKRMLCPVLLIGVGLLVGAVGIDTSVFVSPEVGSQSAGTWAGDVDVLQIENGWAEVRMTGWIPATELPTGARQEGVRVQGSPGAGLWVHGSTKRSDYFGDCVVTGWITNATGQDFSDFLGIDVVLIGEGDRVLGFDLADVGPIRHAETKALQSLTVSSTQADLVEKVRYQFKWGA